MSLFTKIIRKEIPSCKVGAGELWYAFLDINPRRAGHTLVVPVEEKQRLAELSAESRAALMEGVADAQRRLGKVFDTQDFTVVLHDGPLAGQEVPHVHVHVMPRKPNDFARNDDIYEKLETCEEEERKARVDADETRKARSEEEMEKEATEIRRAMMETTW